MPLVPVDGLMSSSKMYLAPAAIGGTISTVAQRLSVLPQKQSASSDAPGAQRTRL
jgi:hypothetical protein